MALSSLYASAFIKALYKRFSSGCVQVAHRGTAVPWHATLAIGQPVSRGGGSPVTKSQRSWADREDEVDRQGLANAVKDGMHEQRISQAELYRRSGISVSTIRLIENGLTTIWRHGFGTLSALSAVLYPDEDLDYLYRVFYRLKKKDPVSPAEIEFIRQQILPLPDPEPELNELRARVIRIEEHLGPDFRHGSGNVASGLNPAQNPHDPAARAPEADRPSASDSKSR